jgi:hypothetical protein
MFIRERDIASLLLLVYRDLVVAHLQKAAAGEIPDMLS